MLRVIKINLFMITISNSSDDSLKGGYIADILSLQVLRWKVYSESIHEKGRLSGSGSRGGMVYGGNQEVLLVHTLFIFASFLFDKFHCL